MTETDRPRTETREEPGRYDTSSAERERREHLETYEEELYDVAEHIRENYFNSDSLT